MASHPPRVAHLLTLPLLAELLGPSYGSANSREAGDVYEEVKSGLSTARLHGALCDAVWAILKQKHADLDDEALVEVIAKALGRKGGPKAKAAAKSREDAMNAMFVAMDIHIGRASDTARLALETPQGSKALDRALQAAAAHLVASIRA